jgi:hypothetical protein
LGSKNTSYARVDGVIEATKQTHHSKGPQNLVEIRLSHDALQELKDALRLEIGEEPLKELSEDDIEHLGIFLLSVHAEAAKMRAFRSL